jgi:hypothetical protein
VLDWDQNPALIPFSVSSAGPCHMLRDVGLQEQSLRDFGYTIVGPIHTHPVNSGTYPNPGNCYHADANGNLVPVKESEIEFSPGPSDTDLAPWAGSADPGYAGYLLQPNGTVWRWEKDAAGHMHRIHFNLNDACSP